METRSKYYRLLGPLLEQPSFSAMEARQRGVSARALSFLVNRGVLERLSRGVYRSAAYETEVPIHLEGLALAASTIPDAVICLISALSYYELTDELPREQWVAIPHGRRRPIRPHTRVIVMRNTELGRCPIRIGEHELMIFDRERCIVDAFRYLSREVAIKALRIYLFDPKRKPHMGQLAAYAKALRVDLTPYIMALTT